MLVILIIVLIWALGAGIVAYYMHKSIPGGVWQEGYPLLSIFWPILLPIIPALIGSWLADKNK